MAKAVDRADWRVYGIAGQRKIRSPKERDRFQKILKADPQSTEALKWLGEDALESGSIETAVDYLTRLTRQLPDSADAHFALGRAYLTWQDEDEALASLSQAEALAPNNAAIQFHLGCSYQVLNLQDEAAHHFAIACREMPESAEAHNFLATALALLQRPEEAITHLEQALTLHPNYPEARQNLEALCRLTGTPLPLSVSTALPPSGGARNATKNIRRAPSAQEIARERTAKQHQQRAKEFVLSKQYDAAEKEYLAALELYPGQTDFATNLGLVYSFQERYEEAEQTLKGVLANNPDAYIAHANLGSLYIKQRRFEEAERVLLTLLQKQPHLVEALKNLGFVLAHMDRYEEALGIYQHALRRNPEDTDVYFKICDALLMLQRYQEAEEYVLKAIRMQTRLVECYIFLANMLAIQGRFEESDTTFEKAFAIDTNDAMVYSVKSRCLYSQGKFQAAIEYAGKALALNPSDAEMHVAYGIFLILTGETEAGWKEYEYRSDTAMNRKSDMPQWQGESLQGKKILVMSEQGMGDMIQFVRFLPLLKKAGATEVIFECYPELTTLLQNVDGMDRMVVRNPRAMPSEPHDLQIRMMSLAYLLADQTTCYAESAPYLHPDPARLPYWQERFASLPGLKVGIVWAGGTKFGGDWNRSSTLEQFLPLIGTPGVTLVSLQKGKSVRQIQTLELEKEILDLDAELKDYADTAAAISQLDLVISVDTSVAHLAGALGCPTWTLLPFCSEWRWLLDRTDTPWYPTMRLFRQPGFRDWESVIREIKTALTELAQLPSGIGK